ncbi:hypothetical protein [Pedobacter sp. Leaf132]|uniref:hypothetical protein n=1 Tax=Pedobacter sp. Leaf132 TaxID=2876557 RepID=UPI001E36228F|nr:hypothetical protein [Pedobacter sp. Leaf132]
MKKLFVATALLMSLNFAAQAQSILNKVGTAAVAASGFNVNGLTSGILGKLTPALNLTPAQKPSVTSIIKDFLIQKAGIMATQKTDPAAYKSKFSKLTSGLKSKLGTVLTVAQLTKFAALKPSANTASNVLSQLFY